MEHEKRGEAYAFGRYASFDHPAALGPEWRGTCPRVIGMRDNLF